MVWISLGIVLSDNFTFRLEKDVLKLELSRVLCNSNFSLYIPNHLAYLISRKSKNWDAYLYYEGQDESEDESDPNQNLIYKTLFFNCMELK